MVTHRMLQYNLGAQVCQHVLAAQPGGWSSSRLQFFVKDQWVLLWDLYYRPGLKTSFIPLSVSCVYSHWEDEVNHWMTDADEVEDPRFDPFTH